MSWVEGGTYEVERVGEEGEGRYGDTDAELEEEEADVNGEEELHTKRTAVMVQRGERAQGEVSTFLYPYCTRCA